MFSTLIYNPLYNLLIAILDFVSSDLGIAIIIMTLIVKIILFPLAKSAIKTQIGMKKIKPEQDAIQEKYKKGKNISKEDRQKMAMELMALYRENNVRPFASLLIVFIQIPILLGLYWIVYNGGLPVVDASILYSFVPVPDVVNMNFLGQFDLTQKSLLLALIAGVAQYTHTRISIDIPEKKDLPKGELPSMKDDFARTFAVQMRYGIPILIAGTSYFFGSAVAIYFITTAFFSLAQEYIVRKDKAELKAMDS